MSICIIFDKIIIADPLADILDCRVRSHPGQHLSHPIQKLIDPVHHPVFITVKFSDILKCDL